MLAVRDVRHARGTRPMPKDSSRDRAHEERSPAGVVLDLQRRVGNAAVARMAERRLQRTPERSPVLEPGTGWDGVRQPHGAAVDRKLTADQVKAVKSYRAWMETTFSSTAGYDRSTWAREAGSRVAAFSGGAQARATLYAELQRQIILVTGGGSSSWVVFAERGADGSYIFRGNPKLEAQKVFVVDPQGNCYVGKAEDGLVGRGAGKAVNYSKLQAIGVKVTTGGGGGGGGGGAGETPKTMPAKAPTVPETPTGGPKGSSTKAPTPARGVFRPVVVSIGVNVLVMVALWWLGKESAEEEDKSRKELVAKKLDPAVSQALVDRSTTLDQLTKKGPSQRLWGNVVADFDYEWNESGIGGHPSIEHLTDIRLVDMTFSGKSVQDEKQIKKDKWTPIMSQTTSYFVTRRVTFSFPVFDPEFEAEQAQLYKEVKEFYDKNPAWRETFKQPPMSDEEAKEWVRQRWPRRVAQLQEWWAGRETRAWRKLLDAEREKERRRQPRVLKVGK